MPIISDKEKALISVIVSWFSLQTLDVNWRSTFLSVEAPLSHKYPPPKQTKNKTPKFRGTRPVSELRWTVMDGGNSQGLQAMGINRETENELTRTRSTCWISLQLKPCHACSVAAACPTLCDSVDCSLPGSSVHGIFQARALKWGATAFSDNANEKTLVI